MDMNTIVARLDDIEVRLRQLEERLSAQRPAELPAASGAALQPQPLQQQVPQPRFRQTFPTQQVPQQHQCQQLQQQPVDPAPPPQQQHNHLLQQQTVDPQQQGVVVALPQQVVQAPAVLGPCTNHVLGRQLAGQAQIPTECNMISTSGDLDSFFTHMQSTLFSADQRGFQWLWYRASEEFRQGRLSVFQCRTQANRTAVFSCPHCLQYTVAKSGHSNSERANLRMARWALLHWFTNPSMPVVPAEAQV